MYVFGFLFARTEKYQRACGLCKIHHKNPDRNVFGWDSREWDLWRFIWLLRTRNAHPIDGYTGDYTLPAVESLIDLRLRKTKKQL